MTRFAPLSELYCSNITGASSSILGSYSFEDKYNSRTEYKRINMRHGVLTTIAPAVKPSTVFTPNSEHRRRRETAKPSFFAAVEQTLINLILPGKAKQSRKPSEVLGSIRPSQHQAGPKSSQVSGSTKAIQTRQFLMPLDTDQNPNHGIMLKVSQQPTASDKTVQSPSCGVFPKDPSLRITLLKHRALKSGIEKPSRPVVIPVTIVDSDSDSDSDNDMEQRMNEFEGWNEYD